MSANSVESTTVPGGNGSNKRKQVQQQEFNMFSVVRLFPGQCGPGRKADRLLVGPVRFVNHSCEPNCKVRVPSQYTRFDAYPFLCSSSCSPKNMRWESKLSRISSRARRSQLIMENNISDLESAHVHLVRSYDRTLMLPHRANITPTPLPQLNQRTWKDPEREQGQAADRRHFIPRKVETSVSLFCFTTFFTPYVIDYSAFFKSENDIVMSIIPCTNIQTSGQISTPNPHTIVVGNAAGNGTVARQPPVTTTQAIREESSATCATCSTFHD